MSEASKHDDKRLTVAMLWPSYADGARTSVDEMARHLDPKRFRLITIFLKKRENFQASSFEYGRQVYCLSDRKRLGCFHLSILRRLVRTLKEERVDILHCHRHKASFYGMLARWRHRFSVMVLHVHGLNRTRSRRREILNRFIFAKADRVAGCAESVRLDIIKANPGADASRIIALSRAQASRRRDDFVRSVRNCLGMTGVRSRGCRRRVLDGIHQSMKLLVLTNNPNRSSFRQRFRVHLDALQEAGIECSIVRIPGDLTVRCKLLKSAVNFDAVYLHKKRLNVVEDWCIRRYCRTLIYDFDDAVMFKDTRPDHRSLIRYMAFRRTVRRSDVAIAGNETLADYARRYCRNVHVLPTGLDLDDYTVRRDHKPDSDCIRLGWIGSASTLNYLEGIRGALEEIGRRFPNVVLRIIADRFLDLDNMPVEKCVWSLAKQASDLAECHIGLGPLPDNRFTRGKCGFKILQYAATGLPFVVSDVGVNRKFADESRAGFVARSEDEWVAHLEALIANEHLRAEMGERARRYAVRFDAGIIGSQLINILHEAPRQHAPAAEV